MMVITIKKCSICNGKSVILVDTGAVEPDGRPIEVPAVCEACKGGGTVLVVPDNNNNNCCCEGSIYPEDDDYQDIGGEG